MLVQRLRIDFAVASISQMIQNELKFGFASGWNVEMKVKTKSIKT